MGSLVSPAQPTQKIPPTVRQTADTVPASILGILDESWPRDEPEPDEMPQATHGVYAVTRLIGSGGMGKVYEAYHTKLKKRVALKTLHGHVADRPEVVRRFLTEGVTASRFSHPHVVTVTDVGEADGVPYLVMEYLEGQSLGERIAKEERLSIEATADVLLPIIDAVATAHEHGIVHCDLKPENIFLATTPAGDVLPKVLDFGISRVARPSEPPSQRNGQLAVVGTPAYMAPEQIRSPESVDSRSDQYALGVVLFEAIAGTRPYDARPSHLMKYLDEVERAERPALHDLRSDSPRELEGILRQALAGDPADRFESLRCFGAALLPFASKRSRTFWGPVYDELATKSKRRRPGPALTIAALAAAAAAGAVAISLWPDTPDPTKAVTPEPAAQPRPTSVKPDTLREAAEAARPQVMPATHRVNTPPPAAEAKPAPATAKRKTPKRVSKAANTDKKTPTQPKATDAASERSDEPAAPEAETAAPSEAPTATAVLPDVPNAAPPTPVAPTAPVAPAAPVKTKRDTIRTDNIDPWEDTP